MEVITLLLTMDVLIKLWPAQRLYQHTVIWLLQSACVPLSVIFYQYDVPAPDCVQNKDVNAAMTFYYCGLFDIFKLIIWM